MPHTKLGFVSIVTLDVNHEIEDLGQIDLGLRTTERVDKHQIDLGMKDNGK